MLEGLQHLEEVDLRSHYIKVKAPVLLVQIQSGPESRAAPQLEQV